MIKIRKEKTLQNMSDIFYSMSQGKRGEAKRKINMTELNLRQRFQMASPREKIFLTKVLTTLKETRKFA